MYAPANVKINGKADEWGGQFLAHNLLNRIYYTVANDDKNLYLVFKTENTLQQEKATRGITFSVNLPAESGKRSKENVRIVFPAQIDDKYDDILLNTTITVRRMLDDTSARGKRKIDSLVQFANKTIDIAYKDIEIEYINEHPEKKLSLYNEIGLKAVARLIVKWNMFANWQYP